MVSERFSKIGFILAASGSAIGLGNIWKFPYMTGENGGGAFVLIYLLTVVLIGVSIFIAESAMGRLSRADSVTAFEKLAPKNGHIWKFAGFMAFTGVLIFSFYTVVIGWIFKYLYVMLLELPTNIEEAGALFGNMVTQDISTQMIFFTLAFFASFLVLTRGIKEGIEKLNLILMPLLFIILFFLLFYSFTLDGFGKSMSFLFVPDFSKVTSYSILTAVGQAFFTLSLGMGTIMTYSAALPKEANLVKSSFSVAFLDTAIALIAGIVIFSIIFNFGAEPSQGAGLVFISLPPLFNQMGFAGVLIGLAFFIALIFAGLTSAISIVEPTTRYLIDRFKLSRIKALTILGVSTYILGTIALLSNVESTKSFSTLFGKGMFDLLDFTTSAILLPLGGLAIAIFVGFVMRKEDLLKLLGKEMSTPVFNTWYFLLKFIIPVCITIVLINELFF
ncbi:MAG: sodium-dependent transporter [Sulfurospirillaceae bacterium]|nr:sodium-dependent transporter [Sulfurospirillaceae bacterium]